MISWRNLFNHLTRLLCLFSLASVSISCSQRYNIHIEIFHEFGKTIKSSLQDPTKLLKFEKNIVPWLKTEGELSADEIFSINFENLNLLLNPKLPPLFYNSKKLFKLVELLIANDLREIASSVLKHIRSVIFYSSTYETVFGSLELDNTVAFDQIMKLWFPNKADVISLIQNSVDLRLGEDNVIYLIELTWDKLIAESSEDFIKKHFARILISSMFNQYVSVFEDILERLPDLINYIHLGLNFNFTIFHYFCRASDPETLNKIKVFKADGTSGETSPGVYYDHRFRSYSTANNDLLAIMMKSGADINAIDSDYMTPLHLAVEYQNAHITQVLVDAGANVNVRNNGGLTPLHLALHRKNLKIAKILIDAGADINARDGDRMTPLHRSIFERNPDTLQFLLENGADYSLRVNGMGVTDFMARHYCNEIDLAYNYFLTNFRNSRSRSVSSNK